MTIADSRRFAGPLLGITVPCESLCQVSSSAGGPANLVEGHLAFTTPEWQNVVPVPPTFALLATGLLGLIGLRRLP